MTVLDTTNRARITAGIQRVHDWPGTLSKADLRAAVDATDAWIDTNAAAFNTALPVKSRNAMSTAEKTIIFCYVAMRRAGLFPVTEDS